MPKISWDVNLDSFKAFAKFAEQLKDSVGMESHDRYLTIFWDMNDFPLAGNPTMTTHNLIGFESAIVTRGILRRAKLGFRG